MLRKTFTASLLGMAIVAHAQVGGGASPIKLVVPFPPGDGLETAARVLGDLVSKDLKIPVLIENRAGASGVIAAEAVARSTDGRTFLIGTTAIMGITPFLRTVPYSPSDFDPVSKFAHISAVMAIRNDIPAKTWAEFVTLAKAAPGKYTYATPGSGTLTHLAVAALTRNPDASHTLQRNGSGTSGFHWGPPGPLHRAGGCASCEIRCSPCAGSQQPEAATRTARCADLRGSGYQGSLDTVDWCAGSEINVGGAEETSFRGFQKSCGQPGFCVAFADRD